MPAAAAATASIRITQPLSNQSYPATQLQVQAEGQGLQAALYRVDGGLGVPMLYDETIQRWAADLDTSRVPPGGHEIDVVGSGTNGAVVSDRAWGVVFPGPTKLSASSAPAPILAQPTPAPNRTAPLPAPTNAPAATWAPTTAAAPLSPRITIQNPLTNQSYTGLILVRAAAASAVSVTYQVDTGPQIAMLLDTLAGTWQAGLNTKTLLNGKHTVTVTATGLSGAVSPQAHAWNIQVSNSSPGLPSPQVLAPAPVARGRNYVFGLIGDDTTPATLAAEYNAGVRAKIIRLSWKDYLPTEGAADPVYVAAKRTELTQLRSAGFQVIADLGLQDTPTWLHSNYADSFYVDQFGDVYGEAGQADQGDANLVFNPALRESAARYVALVFGDLGTDFQAVRLGGGRSGELSYPPAAYNGHASTYWASDINASSANPSPGWKPGQAQTGGEAQSFAAWYLDSLVDFQTWQIATVRRAYAGALMMRYPGWGIRPGQLAEAVAGNLSGGSPVELSGNLERGLDFARQLAAVQDAQVVVTTTWLDADPSQDGSADARSWSPVKYLSSLAGAQPLQLATFGENGGQGDAVAVRLAAGQMRSFGLSGMAWHTEADLLYGQYATLADLSQTTSSL